MSIWRPKTIFNPTKSTNPGLGLFKDSYQIHKSRIGGFSKILAFQEPVVCAEDKPAVSAEEKPVEFAEEKPVVSAEDKPVVSADKKSAVCQDIPQALWTQGRPLRGRPCVDNEVGISWETTDVLSADTTDVLSADTTDVLSADTRTSNSGCLERGAFANHFLGFGSNSGRLKGALLQIIFGDLPPILGFGPIWGEPGLGPGQSLAQARA